MRRVPPIELAEGRFAAVPEEARSAIAFQALDIHATARRLRELGVVFLSDEPIRVGVGLALRFRDPFGNIHALLQQTIGEVAPFEEPEVYNSGFKRPDSDTPALRRMFAGLGFVVRSERYYPPSLPIGHGDGSFAFMLHENEPEEPEVRARSQPESAAVSLIFTAADLAAVQQQVGSGREDAFALGRRMRVTAPSGVPVEFWRLTPDARTRSPTGQVSKPSVRQPTGRHARRRAPGGG
ncbi:MAG: VOC family protein [Sphingosinicella sp.]|uniref:VOC family protein n=1 Tax=Sphingosinicella sp. TaxID=1917971 RepID=UPI004037884E